MGGSSGRTSELSRDLDRIFGIKASTVGRLAATQVIRLSRERALLVGLLQIFFAPAARWVTGSDLAMVCFYNGTATGIIHVWVIIIISVSVYHIFISIAHGSTHTASRCGIKCIFETIAGGASHTAGRA